MLWHVIPVVLAVFVGYALGVAHTMRALRDAFARANRERARRGA